ncbi:MAG: glycosyltransferase family 4 protein [Actinobacteria bacterium]|nr:glycosyltransferase family 4 protein [Actinomycetota bacterium]
MKHLLVTNDFPPKVGGIQSYLWELWRRLPPEDVTVLTTRHDGASAWDRTQPFRIERGDTSQLVPTRQLARRVDALGDDVGAHLVLVDPAFPVGIVSRWLEHPYGVILHGAEVTIPGRMLGTKQLLGRVLRDASLIIAAGGYPAAEGEHVAGRSLRATIVPPGVDTQRFVPLDDAERQKARASFGVDPATQLVLSLSRLVPRKGMDVLIEAAGRLKHSHPRLQVVIGGDGRDRTRLEALASKHEAPVRFLGRVDDEHLPALYGCADVYVMLCRNRWLGREQEGFGIVFLEAAACGIPQVAGRSGGSHEAVADGETGFVVSHPRSVDDAAGAIRSLLDDGELRARLGRKGRERTEREFTYDSLARRLAVALAACEGECS